MFVKAVDNRGVEYLCLLSCLSSVAIEECFAHRFMSDSDRVLQDSFLDTVLPAPRGALNFSEPAVLTINCLHIVLILEPEIPSLHPWLLLLLALFL